MNASCSGWRRQAPRRIQVVCAVASLCVGLGCDEEQLRGLTLVKGLAIGSAVYHQPRVTIEHMMAEDTEAERQRVFLARALAQDARL